MAKSQRAPLMRGRSPPASPGLRHCRLPPPHGTPHLSPRRGANGSVRDFSPSFLPSSKTLEGAEGPAPVSLPCPLPGTVLPLSCPPWQWGAPPPPLGAPTLWSLSGRPLASASELRVDARPVDWHTAPVPTAQTPDRQTGYHAKRQRHKVKDVAARGGWGREGPSPPGAAPFLSDADTQSPPPSAQTGLPAQGRRSRVSSIPRPSPEPPAQPPKGAVGAPPRRPHKRHRRQGAHQEDLRERTSTAQALNKYLTMS